MPQVLYQDKSPEERLAFLRDTCDKMDNFSYEKAYTNQDVAAFCDRLSQLMIEVRQIEAELSKIKKEQTEKMKPMKKELSETMDRIKYRSEMVKEVVYIFIDHEKNRVEYFNSDGVRVYQRMLKIDERQRSIMQEARRNQHAEDEEKEDEEEDEKEYDFTEAEEVTE